jgi:hypothetical protein
MFRAWCDRLLRDVLIWPSSIENISNTDRGILLTYQCVCGNHGHLLTGAASTRQSAGHSPL